MNAPRDRERRAARDRALRDRVFGEPLPTTEREAAHDREGRIDDQWWREQRPPHHG